MIGSPSLAIISFLSLSHGPHGDGTASAPIPFYQYITGGPYLTCALDGCTMVPIAISEQNRERQHACGSNWQTGSKRGDIICVFWAGTASRRGD